MPQVRNSLEPFQTSLLEEVSRSDLSLKSAIATMYVQGICTRRITKVMEELCGFEVFSGRVSNFNKQLDAEFEAWRNRPLQEMIHIMVEQPTTRLGAMVWLKTAPPLSLSEYVEAMASVRCLGIPALKVAFSVSPWHRSSFIYHKTLKTTSRNK